MKENDKSMVSWSTIRDRGNEAQIRGIMCSVAGDELLKIARVGEFLTKQFNFLRKRVKKLADENNTLNAKLEHDSLLGAGRIGRLENACRSTRKGMERMRTRMHRAEEKVEEYAVQCQLMAEQCAAMQQACIAYQQELTQKVTEELETK